MAIYGVVMGQAVSKALLGTDKLTTGYKEGQFLYSCSAIILVNAATGSAGLYHFPAGDIYKDDESRAVIQEMVKDVAPTAAWVAYGVWNGEKVGNAPVNERQTSSLVECLKGLLKVPVSQFRAAKGSAMVAIGPAGVQVSHGTNEGVADLEDYTAGTYPEGFKVYWIQGEIERREARLVY